MMGYLWPCGHCAGLGYVLLVPHKFKIMDNYKRNLAGQIYQYKEPKNPYTHAACQVCRGVGYWEPN